MAVSKWQCYMPVKGILVQFSVIMNEWGVQINPCPLISLKPQIKSMEFPRGRPAIPCRRSRKVTEKQWHLLLRRNIL